MNQMSRGRNRLRNGLAVQFRNEDLICIEAAYPQGVDASGFGWFWPDGITTPCQLPCQGGHGGFRTGQGRLARRPRT